MNESTMLWVLGGMQALTLFLLGWIKIDIKELWDRANTHGHAIDCGASDCKPKTTAVILHEASK